MKMQPKVIVTDLDQTLLRTDKTISAYTMEILKQCQDSGIKIIFATARSTQASKKVLCGICPDVLITYGGALTTEGDKVIQRFPISTDLSSAIIDECLKHQEIFTIFAINETASLANNLHVDSNIDLSHYTQVESLLDYPQEYLKISFCCNDEGVAEAIGAKFPMCDLLHYRDEPLYRLANPLAVKLEAVKAAAAYYQLGLDSFIAFGDDSSDLDLIKNCGKGIAVSNAIDPIKNAADEICDSNDHDGVAKWIQQNILNQRKENFS